MFSQKDFDRQLPRWHPWTWERSLLALGAIAGIIALLVTFFRLDQLGPDEQVTIFVTELALLSVGLMTYTYIAARKKLHRYAQAVFYVHYINHIIRDQVAAMATNRETIPKELLQNIVDATADCFSLLTGKRCRCCIQEVDSNKVITTPFRDKITLTQYPNTEKRPHKIDENTTHEDIWYGKNGSSRFFVSNNLIKLWRAGRYKNTSFDVYGHPETIDVLGTTFVTRWKLPYRSTIVCPIRWIPKDCDWPLPEFRSPDSAPESHRPFIWGFLCIDCRSRNSFDLIQGPDLLAAIADALFTLLHVQRSMLSQK